MIFPLALMIITRLKVTSTILFALGRFSILCSIFPWRYRGSEGETHSVKLLIRARLNAVFLFHLYRVPMQQGPLRCFLLRTTIVTLAFFFQALLMSYFYC